MKYISLFSGIGAPEKALDRLGIEYELVGYSEIDKYASKAYCAVHGVDESMNLGDITKIDENALPKDIDLITYGFPCQDISVAGKGKGLFNEDGTKTRSGLFFDALRIIEATQPKIAIAENVKNLVGKKFEQQFSLILECLESAGYNNYWQVLNTKDYGIPQNRARVFIVSIRKDIDDGQFKFPEPFPLHLRLKDMLEDEVDEKFYLSDEQTARLSCNINYTPCSEEKVLPIGNVNPSGRGQNGSVISADGLARTVTIEKGEGQKVLCAASRGRNPENPSDRTIGAPTEQRLEVRQDGLTNTITTVQKDNYVIQQVAQMYPNSGNPQAGRIYAPEGISPAMDTCQGGNRMPKIVEPIIYDDYNNRIKADQSVIGTLTTNIGSSTPRNGTKIIVREATKQGYAEAEAGDFVNIGMPNSQTRRVRVGKGIANTLTTMQEGAVVVDE